MKVRILFVFIYFIQSLTVNGQNDQEIEVINNKVNFLENYDYSDGELVKGGFKDTIETGSYEAIINKVNSKKYRITYTPLERKLLPFL